MNTWALIPQWSTLPNGLRLARLPQPQWQRTLVQIVVGVGGAHRELELAGQPRILAPGAAHLLEHSVGRQVAQAISAQPALTQRAKTGWWSTSYSTWLTAPEWPLVARCLAAVIAGGLDPQVLEHERKVVAREIAQREADPAEQARRALLNALYHRHAIRQPVTGTASDLAAVSRAQLEQMHAWFYNADWLTLWVAGPLAGSADLSLLGALDLPLAPQPIVWRPPLEPPGPAQATASSPTSARPPAVRIAFKDDCGQPLAWRRITSDLILEALLGPDGPLIAAGCRYEYCGGADYGYSLIEWQHHDADSIAARLTAAIEQLAARLDQPLFESLRRRWRLRQAIQYEQPENLLADIISLHGQQSSLPALAETLENLGPADLVRRLREHFQLGNATVLALQPPSARRQAA